MIALIQRVTRASVEIEGCRVAEINRGLLALIGVEREDSQALADKLLKKILAYRVFEDQQGKMNLGLADVQGGLLLVPQFTLAADTSRGLRPGFSKAAAPAHGERLFGYLLSLAQTVYPDRVCAGVFAADMQVSLVNDGPATFWLQV